MLEIRNLSLSFKKDIFNNVNFVAYEGKIVSISGPSGSGKTSLLKCILGEVKVQTGSIYYNNQEIDENNRDEFLFNYVSYIDQFSSCFTNMTIKEHFIFYSRIHNILINKTIIQKYLDIVNLSHIDMNKSASKLSVGERKRVLIAIALMLKKQIILLDEPTASLDENNIELLLKTIRDLSSQGISFIISTHNDKIVEFSDTVYEIENCNLNKLNINEQERSSGDVIDMHINKPKNIMYFRFKNFRLIVLLISICIFGGVAISFVSHTISSSIVYRLSASQNIDEYKNNTLYLFKTTDERTSLDGNRFLSQDVDVSYIDTINDEEMKRLKKINGIVDIDYSIILENDNSTTIFDGKETFHHIDVFENKDLIKSVSINYYVEQFKRNYNCEIFIVGYSDNDRIPKDGILINETLAKIITIESFENISLAIDMQFPHSFYYDYDYNNYAVISNQLRKQKISVLINDVIRNSEYSDPRFYDYQGVIYVPVEVLKEMLLDIPNVNYSNKDFEYISRQYVIYCESTLDEQIKLNIENMSSRYYVESPSLSNKEMINLLDFQNQSNLYINIMITVIMILSIILLEVYYIKIRKHEINMLKQIGLRKQIHRFFRQDDYFIGCVWLSISLISWYIVKLLLGIDLYVSVQMHLTIWIITTLVIIAFLFGIKIFCLNRVIRGDGNASH